MNYVDIVVSITRWAHLLATVTWIGGNIFFYVVVRPSLRDAGGPPSLGGKIGARFKEAVDLSMWVLLITGAPLVYDRLAGNVPSPYWVTLSVKLLLSFGMFGLAISLGRRGPKKKASPLEGGWADILPRALVANLADVQARWAKTLSPTNLMLFLGPVIILIAVLLRLFYP